jgi:hypothetical protein
VTDVIGGGAADAPARAHRNRVPRWVGSTAVVAVLVGIIVVPMARAQLADSAAGWLRDEWGLRTAYDDARAAVIFAVSNRAGVLDRGVVEGAARTADNDEAAALGHVADRMARHRTWGGDVHRARDAALAALREEVEILRHDAASRHPTTGYLYAPAVQRLGDVASRRIAAMARDHHLGPARTIGVRLPPADAALAQLASVTDVATGLSVVLTGRLRPRLLDLDTGRLSPLAVPARARLKVWSDRIVVMGRDGVRLVQVGGAHTELVGRYAELLSTTGRTLWLSGSGGVRQFDGTGRPLTKWLRVPTGRSPVAAVGDVVMLVHVMLDEGSLIGELWNPRTGALRTLPTTCYGGWAAAGRTVVALPCENERSVAVVDTVTGRIHRVPLPGQVTNTASEAFSPLSPDGTRLAVVIDEPGPATGLLDLRTGRFQPSPFDVTMTPVAWSPDSRWLLLADAGSFTSGRRPLVALWRPKDGRLTSVRLPAAAAQLDGVEALLLSPAG